MVHHLGYSTVDRDKFVTSAYKKAVDALKAHGTLDGFEALRGIGPSIRTKMDQVIAGVVPEALTEAEKFGPPFSVRELTRLPGYGPAGARKLYETHGIASIEDLKKAVETGHVTDTKLVTAYWDMVANSARIPRAVVHEAMQPVLAAIKSTRGIHRVILPGSYRRRRADVRDIDVLIEVDSYASVRALTATLSKKLGFAVSASGERKAYMEMPILDQTRKLDLNFIETDSWGTAVLHFTGPALFNEAVRSHIKQKHGWSLSQYHLTCGSVKKTFANEEDVFEAIGLPYIPPTKRDYCLKVTEPAEEYDLELAGDTHHHTTDSDGTSTPEQVYKQALASGMAFVCFTDHGPALSGPTGEALLARTKEWRKRATKIPVFHGAEVDVRVDGTLDYPDDVLRRLDYVIVSLHTKRDNDPIKRLRKAFAKLDDLNVPMILAHPTGRIIGERSEMDVDYGELFKLCRMHGVALEINSQPDRCDLPCDRVVQAVRQYKLKFVIASDCHERDNSSLLPHGLMVADRASLSPKQVLNSSLARFKDFLRYEDQE